MNDTILTIQGVAEYLQIDEKTAYRMAQRGELPGFKVRRQWRFKRSDLDLWIESKKSAVAARSTSTPATGTAKERRVTGRERDSRARERGR